MRTIKRLERDYEDGRSPQIGEVARDDVGRTVVIVEINRVDRFDATWELTVRDATDEETELNTRARKIVRKMLRNLRRNK